MANATNLVQARAARPDDVEAMLRVLCAAFGIDSDAARPLFYEDPFFDLTHKRILVTPTDGLVSCLTVIPSKLRIGASIVPVGGIAGVATIPTHQRQGYGGLLLSATVGALADELSYPAAALFPYSYGFYRKFGWETASRSATWSGPASCLPRNSEAEDVRPVRQESGQDQAAIHRLHEMETSAQTGGFQRDQRRWKVIETLTPARQSVVYERSGEVEGYLFFESRAKENPPSLIIHEMHGSTDRARRGLIGFLARYEAESLHIEWDSSPENLSLFGLFSLDHLEGARPQVSLHPGMMFRLVDLAAALARLHSAQFAPVLSTYPGTITIRASDPMRSQNERPIRLHKSGVHPGSFSDREWISASITVLAQLYAGYRTPSDAAAVGDLQAASGETLALADLLFPQRHPFAAPTDQF